MFTDRKGLEKIFHQYRKGEAYYDTLRITKKSKQAVISPNWHLVLVKSMLP